MKAFILAGGFATRLWPLTERRAKPLLPIKGEPLLTHLLRHIPSDMSVTVSTNTAFAQDLQQWAATIRDRPILDILTEDSGHDDQKIGALGAVAKWVKDRNIQEDVLLLAGDNYLDFNMGEFIAIFRGNPLLAAYDIGNMEQAKDFGTVILSDTQEVSLTHTVKAFEEKPQVSRSSFVSTGCYILPASQLELLKGFAQSHPDNIGSVFEEFLRQKVTVDCFLSSGLWRDIGSFDSYLTLHCDLLRGQQIIDPSATIDHESVLVGSVVIGPRCRIAKSTLTDCMLFADTTVDDCVVERCIIDEQCDLKGVDITGKMLRAKTNLRRV